MFAVVETGGKQFKIKPQDIFRVEKLEGDNGKEILLDKVMLVSDESFTQIGKPYVKGAVVRTTVKGQIKGKKVKIFRYKAKKRVRVKNGHRQKYTLLEVQDIAVGQN